MTNPYTPRQHEILTMLAKYGVLGTKTISTLLTSSVKIPQLLETLKGMEKRGLICRILFQPGGSPMSHWMLPLDPKIQKKTLAATGLDERFFRRKAVRYSHIPHEILCTFVHASLERQLPELWVVREASSGFNTLPTHLLSKVVKDKGYAPDLCIGVPNENADPAHSNTAFRWIAVEVDRVHRSHKRIAQRLNVYTKHTTFSGVLYLMPTTRTAEVLKRIYDTRGGKDNLRLHGTSKSFLAVSTVPESLFDVNSKSVWCEDQEISLATWISLFKKGEAYRRDRALSGFA